MPVMGSTDPEWEAHAELFDNLRTLLRKHQRHLIENPDSADPWWFLVDPDAPEGGGSWNHSQPRS